MLGAVLGSAALTIAYLRFSNAHRGFKQAATAAFGGLMLGAITGFFSTSIINGVFDRSPPVYVEIEAEQYWQETVYPFFIRKYELEFRRRPGQQTKKHMTTPEVLAGFMGTGTGIAEYGQGAFGMTWLRQLFPTELVPLLDGDPEELVVLAFDTEEDDGTITRTTLKPVINLPDGSTYQPSKRMIKRIRELLTEE